MNCRTAHHLVLISVFVLYGLLTACSDDRNPDDNPWSAPQMTTAATPINNAHFASNSQGSIASIWQTTTTEERKTEQACQQKKVANDTDNRPIFEAEGYASYLYSQTDIWSQIYDSRHGQWDDAQKLQAGKWVKTQKKCRDIADNHLISTENISAPLNASAKIAIDNNNQVIAIWPQADSQAQHPDAAAASYHLYSSQFDPNSNQWSTPEKRASNIALRAQGLQLSMSNSGDAIVLWLQINPNNGLSNVYASTFTSHTWNTNEQLSEPNAAADQVRIKTTNNNISIALWRQLNDKAGRSGTETQHSLYARWHDISDWSSSTVLVSDAQHPVIAAELSIDNSTGHSWAIWQQSDASSGTDSNALRANSSIWVSHFSADNRGTHLSSWRWSPPATVQTDLSNTADINEANQHAYQARIAQDTAGNAMAIWVQDAMQTPLNTQWNNNKNSNIWVNYFTNATWQDAQILDDHPHQASSAPVIAASTSGRFAALWQRWSTPIANTNKHIDSSGYDIRSRVFQADNHWGGNFQIDKQGSAQYLFAIDTLNANTSMTAAWVANNTTINTSKLGQ